MRLGATNARIGRVLFLVLAPVLSGAWACGNRSPDEGNLKATAAFYYAPGARKALSPDKAYRFLSEASKARLAPAEFVKAVGNDGSNPVRAIDVLGEREVAGRRFAIVSVGCETAGIDGRRLRYVCSATWVMESGKWRRMIFPALSDEAGRAYDAGDHAKAKAKAREWLALDPFAVDAHVILAAASGVPPGDPSLVPAIRALLSINPDDTEALYCAATCVGTQALASGYLKKLEGTDRYLDAARNVLEILGYPDEMQDIMEETGFGVTMVAEAGTSRPVVAARSWANTSG